MSQINLFRIETEREKGFKSRLKAHFKKVATKVELGYEFVLFKHEENSIRRVSWNWVFELFGESGVSVAPQPKALLLVRRKGLRTRTQTSPLYVITFGAAFFDVNPFADGLFAFEYARRVPIRETRLTATTQPASKERKTISSFNRLDKLEISSGASYTKLKLAVKDSSSSDFLNEVVEIGVSIKFNLKKDTFATLTQLINYVEIVLKGDVVTPMPVFNLIKDEETVNKLEKSLREKFDDESRSIAISEFDIVGTTEVFSWAEEYMLRCDEAKQRIDHMDMEALGKFYEANGINDPCQKLKTYVDFYRDGRRYRSTHVHDILDFYDDEHRALLVDGKWHRYNDDFLSHLKTALADLPVIYDSAYDLTEDSLGKLRSQMLELDRNKDEWRDLSEDDRKKKIKRKFYREYAFNHMRRDEGFGVIDRKLERFGKSKIEVGDLIKDGVLYSVKFGHTSGELAYVVTQSEVALNYLDSDQNIQGERRIIEKPEKVALWLVFTGKKRYRVKDNRLDWDSLGMLLLKIRICEWKKRVRLWNAQPEIRINYDMTTASQ